MGLMASKRKIKRLKPRIGRLPPRLPRAHADGQGSSGQRNVDAPWQRWYRTARWFALRKLVLVRDAFTCRKCGRLEGTTSKLVCDHIVPHRGTAELFWDEGNCQTLCVSCHNKGKQAEEAGSFAHRGVWD
jgi:5-methylcytosine-specific restriction endonuclease McrA